MKPYTLMSLLLLFAYCKNPTHSPTSSLSADSIGAPVKAKVDTPVVEITKMLNYFRRDSSGHIDSKVAIDRLDMIKIFGDTTMQWTSIESIHPIDVIRRVRGTFFIVKVNCSAGGQCEEYYLIGYNTENRPVAPEYLGGLMAASIYLLSFMVT